MGGLQRGLSGAEAQMVLSTLATVQVQMIQFQVGSLGDLYQSPRPGHGPGMPGPWPCYPMPPRPPDRCHPPGSLKTDPNGVVTTPGGYKVEPLGQFEWKITGPDGKSTRIWGDPHVDEGDGGKWDFKRDSTFVLGDGTRINVTTKPYGNGGMTVTGGLEIISGNDRVQITDIDKGKGQTGPVTHDGFQHVNSFGGKDVFVMGRETDDWSFQGREIIGSNNGGDTFRLGQDLPPGVQPQWPRFPPYLRPHLPPPPLGGGPLGPGGPQGILPGEPAPGTQPHPILEQMRAIFQSMASMFGQMSPFSDMLSQRHWGNNHLCAPGHDGNWMSRRQNHLGQGFYAMSQMMSMYMQMQMLSQSVQPFRSNFMA